MVKKQSTRPSDLPPLNRSRSHPAAQVEIASNKRERGASIREAISLIRNIKLGNSKDDKERVNCLIDLGIEDESDASTVLLLEGSLFFDCLGDTKRAHWLATLGFERARKSSDVNLQRRACNIAAVTFARACDYEQACVLHEQAIRLASNMEKPVFLFAALCNVVSTLELMGLIAEAKDLALRLSRFPDGTEDVNYLHLQNAINGLRLASFGDDQGLITYFDKITQAKVTTSGRVDNLWIAFVDANNALALIGAERYEDAYNTVTNALNKIGGTNTCAVIRLECVLAKCVVRQGQVGNIDASKKRLKNLLTMPEVTTLDQEQLIRALVALHSTDRTAKGKRATVAYLGLLSQHLINIKHRQFFSKQVFMSRKDVDGLNQMSGLFYTISSCLSDTTFVNAAQSADLRLEVGSADHVQRLTLDYTTSAKRKAEIRLRSKAFDVAEEWAIAADFGERRAGQHCFEVARLAGRIASRIGKSESEAVLIEMACRLHDVGKILEEPPRIGDNVFQLEEYTRLRKHALAGHHLLSSSSDPVFILASKIALHHHEWWNGCGLPFGLIGEEIPLEARICRVADTFIAMLNPSTPYLSWQMCSATNQVLAMSGFQLDPSVVVVLVDLIESGRHTLVEAGFEEAALVHKTQGEATNRFSLHA